MKNQNLKWYNRFQFEIGCGFRLFASRDVTWRQWLFDPCFGVTLFNQEITSRYQLPESTNYGVDTFSVGGSKEYYSNVFWIHGAIRILGLDTGIGIFYRRKDPNAK